MNFRLTLFCIALVLVAGGLFRGAQVLAHQGAELAALHRRAEQLEKEIAVQQRQRDAAASDLAAAERQLAEIPDPVQPAATEAERVREKEIAGWLERVRLLKQHFEEQPEQRIPEMRLLTDDDWLRVGRKSSLEGEENVRRALAAVRSAAKNHFTARLGPALQKLAKDSGGKTPATIMELAPLLESPADVDILPRYEIATDSYARKGQPTWMIQEKSPVDADYDDRYFFYPNGGSGSMNAPLAWIPDYRERSQRAYKDYAAANKGADPNTFAAVIPYFNPPLDPAVAEKVLKVEREREEKR